MVPVRPWILVLLLASAMVIKHSKSWPIGGGSFAGYPDAALAYDLANDYPEPFYGPYSLDYLRASRFAGGPYGYRYGIGDPYGYRYGIGDPFNPATDISTENYVRDYPYGGTEFGVRDSVTYRPGGFRSPFPRMYPGNSPYPPRFGGGRPWDRFNGPYDYYESPWDRFSPYRRMMTSQLANARPSSLRYGGDMMYLKR